MIDYDAELLKSRGFRIKQLGDGFLCSVGYPFNTASGRPSISEASLLSEKFVSIMKEESSNFFNGKPICCSIAIAYGNIEGFFPSGGTKQYDMFGQGIVLATRYEDARHFLLEAKPELRGKHIIILSRIVYEGLESSSRREFEKFDFFQGNFRIRDDKDEQFLYFKAISP